MSILVVGASHRSAPVELLEKLAVDAAGAAKLRTAALHTEHVREAVVLATCNRIEVYAEVERFHGGVDDLTALLADFAGVPGDVLVPSLYVLYDEAAVAHLFSVATGLDSMVVGESQILGQVRDALRGGQNDGAAGPALNILFQQGLRVGKRAHAETGIDAAGQSVVSVALDFAAAQIGPLQGVRACIVGAGSIAALSAAALRRAGAGSIVVCSRTLANAERLAVRVAGTAVPMSDLPEQLRDVHLVVSCTGATGVVVGYDAVAGAVTERASELPLLVVDLALPHDVDPRAADLPDVLLMSLKDVADRLQGLPVSTDVAAVKAIVAEEVAAFVAARHAARVAPTVVALRTMATSVVAAELERLWTRVDGLDSEARLEVAATVRRVVEKLLHEPTVRIKELAGRTPDASYAEALAELFALDPASVEAVTRPSDVE